MKKTMVSFFILAYAVMIGLLTAAIIEVPEARMSVMIVGGSTPVTTTTTSVSSCDFESGWEGAGPTDGGTWDGETGSGILTGQSSDQKLQGTYSLKAVASGTATDYVTDTCTASEATVGFRFGIYIDSDSGTIEVFNCDGSSSAGYLKLRVTDTTMQVYAYTWSGLVVVGDAFSYSDDTWYQVEIEYVQGTSFKWKVWNEAGDELVHSEQTLTASLRNETLNNVSVGLYANAGSATYTGYLDAFCVQFDGYPGPI